jgi:3-oxoacyl-[acyl-carrier-protein] synthase II
MSKRREDKKRRRAKRKQKQSKRKQVQAGERWAHLPGMPQDMPVSPPSFIPRPWPDAKVVITGLGLITGLGDGAQACWESLQAGRSGLAAIRRFETEGHAADRGGEAPPLSEGPSDPRDRAHAYLVRACTEAMRQSGRETFEASESAALILGSSLAAQASAPRFWASLVEEGPEKAALEDLRCYDVELRLQDLFRRFGCDGESLLLSNACAAGASAIGMAADLIRLGRARAALVAGYDALDLHTHAGFGAIRALDPAGPRPFAPDRSGMLLGDGYAALVIEPEARARGAGRPILARFLGHGESADAHHLTQPDPQGLGAALAMRRALSDAGLTPADVDAINVHCTATPVNDAAEVSAMRAVFGERLAQIPLCASKPSVGHTLGGAGAVETAIALLSLRHRELPASLNTGALDPALGDLDVVSEGRRERGLRVVMSNSFGFGGCNTSLVLGADA